LAFGTAGAAITLDWLGFSRISSDSSGPAAHEALERIVNRKITRHTNGVKGILLNIPFLPARNVEHCFNRYVFILSRKK
jgi:hypothetical protein